MPHRRTSFPTIPPPWTLFFLTLLVVSSVESVLMLCLKWLVPPTASPVWTATVDSILLTVIVSPVLWLTIVSPLRRANQLRDSFLSDLFRTIEDERRRIALELHDGVGQTLSMLVSGLKSPELVSVAGTGRREHLMELAQRALQDVRQLSHGLRPSLLDDLGLAAAIGRIVEEVREHHQLTVDFENDDQSSVRPVANCEIAAYRIFQEAIANCIRHAHATQLVVRLRMTDDSIALAISDNGQGIARSGLSGLAKSGHFGLTGMKERAQLLGGTFDIVSVPGKGTTLVVFIPLLSNAVNVPSSNRNH